MRPVEAMGTGYDRACGTQDVTTSSDPTIVSKGATALNGTSLVTENDPMKALRVHELHSSDGLRLDEIVCPEPQAHEVRVVVEATALAFVDLLMARGGYQVCPPTPFIAGSEFGGVIDACGADVPGWLRPGMRVGGSTFYGAWAGRICVPYRSVHQTADTVPSVEAAALAAPFGTAHYALALRARLQEGETVLVLGAAGSVGHAAVQVAKALGATVIAAASSAPKREAALQAGADQVVDSAARLEDAGAGAGPGRSTW